MTRNHLPNPSSLTAEQRAEYRNAIVGVRYNGHRTDLPDGSCYYANEDGPGRFTLHAFAGKALRPSFIESYRTRERLDERIAAFLASRERKAQQHSENMAARRLPHTLKVGDVLNTRWGYEQTNAEFYEVVGVRGSHVLLRRLAVADAGDRDSQAMTGELVPLPGEYSDAQVLRKRAGASNCVRINSYIVASPWNGKPVAVSSYH